MKIKIFFLLATGLLFAGCGQPEDKNREVLNQIASLKSELAVRHAAPVRWALANKSEIQSAIYQFSRDKMELAKKTEALSPELEEKVRQYETLQGELSRKQMEKRMESMRHGFRGIPLPPLGAGVAETNQDEEVLAQKVEAAKAPVAEIIERRRRLEAQFNDQTTVEKLVAEYVKDRFDLVIDGSDARYSRSAVLYQNSGEATDITVGVIKLFREKTRQ